jgi:hypothetical protein
MFQIADNKVEFRGGKDFNHLAPPKLYKGAEDRSVADFQAKLCG